MVTSNVSLKFYLNTYKLSSGRHPVYARIIVDRKKAEIATDHFLEPDEWDEKRAEAKKNNKVNASLADTRKQILDTIYILEKENQIVSAHSIKFYLSKKNVLDPAFLNFFKQYIEVLKKAKELIPSTISRYEDTLNHLEVFLQEQRKYEIPISKIDYKLVTDFDLYLLNQKTKRTGDKLQRNTANKHHARLKTVLLRAMRENLLAKNPYNDFKMKYTPSNRTFLSQEELDKISKYSFEHNKSLDRVKDIFLFSVYTGLRFVDAQNLSAKQIVQDKKGNYCIDTIQDKTKRQILIPLLKPAINILEKYNGDERSITGKVLPKISNQKFNVYLKNIGVLVGIQKPLSHHIARHTCATTVLLSNDTPIEAVSRWLGHTSIRTTQVYAKITKEYLGNVAKKINKKIN